MERFILVIDQGTTSTRAMLFDARGIPVAAKAKELEQFYPQKGWVEHDPEQIFIDLLFVCEEVCKSRSIDFKQIAAIGITNQRETTIVWERSTGKPIYPAIVWQDRRTQNYCERLKKRHLEEKIKSKTGLLLDPYFSASKINWILDNVPNSRSKAQKGELAFGTIDSYLLWKLTDGKVHATDVTNASRTSLYNIYDNKWDEELLRIFDIPRYLLPEVKNCTADYGKTSTNIFSIQVPITGVIGDQQAATFGQACFEPGMVKSTYGTGCFIMLNTGTKVAKSKNNLLSTIAYKLNNETIYALEGSIFMAGAIIQWLRDSLGIIKTSAESEELAKSVPDNNDVYLIPAFTGMGAPYWKPDAKAAIVGLSRDSNKAHIVRAGIEAVCYQSKDLIDAMAKDVSNSIEVIRVDGGMINNSWMMQYLADILRVNISCSKVAETTAQGAAFVAGLSVGMFASLSQISGLREQAEDYQPKMPVEQSKLLYVQWQQIIKMILAHRN